MRHEFKCVALMKNLLSFHHLIVFNALPKTNIISFSNRFQLSNKEIEELSRCKFCTLNTGLESNGVSRSKFLTLNKGSRGSNIKYAPFAFTEQGIYMLMTVLKGDLAIQQSMALIRLFKQLKDYAVSEGLLLNGSEVTSLALQTAQNTRDIAPT